MNLTTLPEVQDLLISCGLDVDAVASVHRVGCPDEHCACAPVILVSRFHDFPP